MDEMIALLEEIRDLLAEMNGKLDDIKGYGADNSISDVCDKINEISGHGFYSLSDVCSKIDDLSSEVDGIKGIGIYNTLGDVCDKLDSIETAIDLK